MEFAVMRGGIALAAPAVKNGAGPELRSMFGDGLHDAHAVRYAGARG